MIWLAVAQFAIAIGAGVCVRIARPDRNYWPMVRLMFGILAAIYAGAGVNTLGRWTGQPVTRAIFSLLMLAGILYALWFIRRRNHTPRYLPLTLAGETALVPVPELWRDYERAISLTAHGDAPPQWVAQMEQALARWRVEQSHPQTLGQRMRQDAQERAARRQGGIE